MSEDSMEEWRCKEPNGWIGLYLGSVSTGITHGCADQYLKPGVLGSGGQRLSAAELWNTGPYILV